MKRYQALDSVRGIAIILVLIWHYLPRNSATPNFLLGATQLFWSGVDLFFVLSGFLIGGILLQNANSKHYFSTFYVRRAVRIIPLYILILLIFTLIIYLSPPLLVESVENHLPLWSYLTFTQNFFYASRAGFNDPWIDVTWSLAVEEQFYILLSLLVKKLNKSKLFLIVIELFILAPILRFYTPNPMVAYVLPLHRADSLMLGVLIALGWQWQKSKDFLCTHIKYFQWAFVILLTGFVYLTVRGNCLGDAISHLWLALFYGNFVILALLRGDKKGGFFFLNNRVLEWFGLRSYGVYLLHQPVHIVIPIFLVSSIGATFSQWAVLIICVAVLFGVSELSYRIIEKPFMNLGHSFKYD